MNWAIRRRLRSFFVSRGLVAGVWVLGGMGPVWSDSLTATPVLRVDNFNGGHVRNALGGENRVWIGDVNDPSVSLKAAFDSENRRGVEGNGLRLEYDIRSVREHLSYPSQTKDNQGVQPVRRQGTGFGGYTLPLMDLDARPYRYLSVWVRGDARRGYTRRLRVELFDGEYVGRYWIDGLNDKWEEASIPLDRFEGIRSFATLKSMTFVFDDGMSNREGVVYLDDVEFRSQRDAVESVVRPGAVAQRSVAPRRAGTSWLEGTNDATVVFEPKPGRKRIFGSREPIPKGRFLWRWDSTFLYLSVDVADAEVENINSGSDVDQGDCVEVYLKPGDSSLVWDDPSGFRLAFAPTGTFQAAQAWAYFQRRRPSEEEVFVEKVSSSQDDDGYALEARIRWSFLGAEPSDVREMGMGVVINDPAGGKGKTRSAWGVEVDANTRHLGRLVLQ